MPELPDVTIYVERLQALVVGEVLGTLRSFSGRVYTDGDHEVHHSWLKIEDLEPSGDPRAR